MRASTAATRTTTPAIAMRCQSIRVYSLGIERLPAGEALIDAVPVGDLVLTEAPAQERLGAGDLRRKVDEAGVRVLHDPAELVDRVGTAGDTGMLTGDLLVEGVPAAHVAPIACDLERELPPLGLGRCEGRPVLDELFRQRPHLREQRVRLLAGEVSRRHVRMIE